MNAIVKVAHTAKSQSTDWQLRNAEIEYHQAMRVFGVDSAEAKVAWIHWCQLRREIRD